MNDYIRLRNELKHHGIKGQKWGVRRYQNEDGTLTDEGKKRYGLTGDEKLDKEIYEEVRKRGIDYNTTFDELIRTESNLIDSFENKIDLVKTNKNFKKDVIKYLEKTTDYIDEDYWDKDENIISALKEMFTDYIDDNMSIILAKYDNNFRKEFINYKIMKGNNKVNNLLWNLREHPDREKQSFLQRNGVLLLSGLFIAATSLGITYLVKTS